MWCSHIVSFIWKIKIKYEWTIVMKIVSSKRKYSRMKKSYSETQFIFVRFFFILVSYFAPSIIIIIIIMKWQSAQTQSFQHRLGDLSINYLWIDGQNSLCFCHKKYVYLKIGHIYRNTNFIACRLYADSVI